MTTMLRTALLIATLLGSTLGGAATGSAQGPNDRLNVLFIAVDDLNNDLGCYGHPLVQSPNIDALAQRGVRFNHAYCQYPVCNPSRSSLMTGFYPEQTGVLSNGGNFRDKLPDVVTLPQKFRETGYFAARVGKIYHYGVPLQIGTDGKDDPESWETVRNPIGIDRTRLDDVNTLVPGQYGGTLSWLSIPSDDEEHTDGLVASEAIQLLEDNQPSETGRPFFLAVGFYRPHTPFVAPKRYFDLYPLDAIEPVLERPDDRDDIPPAALADRPKQRDLTVEQRKEIIQAYYASISFMDAQVGRLIDALERLNLTESTVIVFVSDHGYHLGAHGLWQKSDLFEGSTRVPLIVVDPRIETIRHSTDAVVEMVDLYPTLIDLCFLSPSRQLVGQSLARILLDPRREGKPAAYTVARARNIRKPEGKVILGRSIRTPRFRYTEWGDDAEYGRELYDYQTDPEEYTNRADDPALSDVRAELQELLENAKGRAR